MKIRKDREALLHATTFPMLLILGEKDPVLSYEDNLKQIENTTVKLVTFPDGHMSNIENRAELTSVLQNFFKSI
jgi:pimeloyl-ACP methyl ester carboxylesterase